MIRINNTAFDYRPGMSLRHLAQVYYADNPKATTDFDNFMIVRNSVALTSRQAEETLLADGDSVYMVPKLDGG